MEATAARTEARALAAASAEAVSAEAPSMVAAVTLEEEGLAGTGNGSGECLSYVPKSLETAAHSLHSQTVQEPTVEPYFKCHVGLRPRPTVWQSQTVHAASGVPYFKRAVCDRCLQVG